MRGSTYLVIAVAASVALLVMRRGHPSGPMSDNTIVYQGQTVKLSRSYGNYEEYKDDPNNLDLKEKPKIEHLVSTAQISKHYSSREAMIKAVFELKFPGYGLEARGEQPQSDGSTLALFSVEIPLAGKDRVLLFQGNGGQYSLLDDFIYPNNVPIAAVAKNGSQLAYSGQQGAKLVERTANGG